MTPTNTFANKRQVSHAKISSDINTDLRMKSYRF
uniref:Uncharacterized protein n=1 Tax=Lepeophtheirus salmonis TaxID=72036 RepID=A0A0K2UZI6_LEPSM